MRQSCSFADTYGLKDGAPKSIRENLENFVNLWNVLGEESQ